ncbi:DUF2252 family protein [Hymenobacter caeli]|uniref:Uncharacterized protein (DUF2252 family) n=1 Tax=Hymenobacter caeli TaxID=2735894 RepID=A0ABX2FJP5_9BACT|nr:DUF2252 family protein [Hymenobacter caeli]NRT17246.1 uncharacterized protein (DUF2252 family) [Hymenobacter caeli]
MTESITESVTESIIESVAEFIQRHDAGRVPELLALRYHRMQVDALAFFRGSAPLYYARFRAEPLLGASPAAWLCGDAHVENFGSFRGDNRLVYFDLNDFDEAVLGPVLWDVGRLVVSVLLAAARFGLPPAARQALAQELVAAYAAALAAGKAYQLERATARGVVQHLLTAVAQRRQRALLAGRASRRGGWHLLPREAPTLRPLPPAEHRAVLHALEAWRQAQGHPPCGPLLDVAGRIAGVGSLGVPRYAVLAEALRPGKLPRLLDLKAAAPAAPAIYCPGPQPAWPSEAARVVAAQVRLQAVPPALLQALALAGQPFVLRALQPVADKLDFSNFTHGAAGFRAALPTFGRLLAWAHLRAAGRQGAAGPDELMAFGEAAADWLPGLLHFATAAKAVVREDFHSFRRACRAGQLPTAP